MKKVELIKEIFVIIVCFTAVFFVLKQFFILPEAEFRLVFISALIGYLLLLLAYPKIPSTIIFLFILCFIFSWNFETWANNFALTAYIIVAILFIQYVRGRE